MHYCMVIIGVIISLFVCSDENNFEMMGECSVESCRNNGNLREKNTGTADTYVDEPCSMFGARRRSPGMPFLHQ